MKSHYSLSFLLFFIVFISVFNPLHAQGKSIKRIEKEEKEALVLYEQAKYKEACDILLVTTQQRSRVQTSRIQQELFIIFLLLGLGFFMFLYLEKQKAYKKLVSKNMQCASREIVMTSALEIDHFNITDEKEKKLLFQLQELFTKDKVYLNSDLTVSDLAKQLGTSRTILSHIINTYLNKNFPSLLNEYRINEAIRMLMDQKSSNFKMEAISDACGFNNRQAFHAAFKKETGITPNDFKKMSQEKNLDEVCPL